MKFNIYKSKTQYYYGHVGFNLIVQLLVVSGSSNYRFMHVACTHTSPGNRYGSIVTDTNTSLPIKSLSVKHETSKGKINDIKHINPSHILSANLVHTYRQCACAQHVLHDIMWYQGSMTVAIISALREPHRAHTPAGIDQGMHPISPYKKGNTDSYR